MGTFDSGKWKDYTRDKIRKLDIIKIKEDVRPFLERQGDEEMITRENLEPLVRP